MVKVGNCIQKYKPKNTDITISIKNNSSPNVPSCCMPNCHSYPLSRCPMCSSYCRYNPVYGHDHPLKNFEILK